MDYEKREDIELDYTWDLTTRYKTDEDWEKEYEILKKDIKKISKYEGILLKSANNLSDALDEYYDLMTTLYKLYIYANLKHDEDLGNNKYSLMLSKALNVYTEFATLSSYITPEILSGSETKLNNLLSNKKLKKYKFLLENVIREKDHTLSKSEEKIVAKLSVNSDIFDKISSTLTDSTLNYGKIMVDGKETTLTNSNYRNIMTNANRETRKECFTLMTNKMKEFSNIFADTLVANMKEASSIANIRNYKSTLDMQLFSSNIPSKVLDNLYDVIHQRLNIFQKYFIFIKKNLGLNKLEYYDINTNFLTDNMSFTIENANDLISEATKIYGEEYHNIILKAFKERWIDWGSYKGKKSGAYCTSSYGTTPVVLTNFHGKFTDVSAVAHELGHAVNFYLSENNNQKHDYENDIFVAEVASLTNEIILSNYIMNKSNNKNLKLLAIYNLIDIIQNNLFDAALEGELENKIYKLIDNKEEVSADMLSNTIYDIRKEYYGNTIELDENVKYMWARRAHYYMPFYLFQYATGVSAAVTIATKIINDEDNMKDKYVKFLKKGSTDYPVKLLKNIGVDMTKPDVINKAIDYFDYLIDEFNRISEE
jgi:oligoendopeptidase F